MHRQLPNDFHVLYVMANSSNNGNGTLSPKAERAIACCVGITVTAIFCGLILLLVLLPLSFVTLEYYEFGLKRSRTRGVVDTERVYGPGGRYFMSPDTVFQVCCVSIIPEVFK